MKRKAQASGGAAGTVVGLILVMMIFYILFIPPEERKALLEGEELEENGLQGLPKGGIIYSNPIGKLSNLGTDKFDHRIPNLFLTEAKEAQTFATINPFIARKGLFRKQYRNASFFLPEPELVSNAIATFRAPIRKGDLVVLLNGVQLFEGALDTEYPTPLKLPQSLLKQNNVLEFRVLGFGLFPKMYSIEDLKIIGDITDITKQTGETAFTVNALEHDNIESGYLAFYPICTQSEASMMTTTLNGKIVQKSVPACESENRIDLFQEDLRPGKNTLKWEISEGTYRLEQMNIRTFVKPVTGFSDFFFIEEDVYDAIVEGKRDAIIEIQFVDDAKTKKARLNINGRMDILDQKEAKYFRDISPIVRDGNNFIEILPYADLEIISVEVRVTGTTQPSGY